MRRVAETLETLRRDLAAGPPRAPHNAEKSLWVGGEKAAAFIKEAWRDVRETRDREAESSADGPADGPAEISSEGRAERPAES